MVATATPRVALSGGYLLTADIGAGLSFFLFILVFVYGVPQLTFPVLDLHAGLLWAPGCPLEIMYRQKSGGFLISLV